MSETPRKYQGALVRPKGRPDVPFYIVPEPVFTSKTLSPESRLVIAWLCGKPSGWSACVSEIRRSLAFSEKVWRRVKTELKVEGVIPKEHPQRVKAGKDGFVWALDVDLRRFFK